MSDVWLAVLVIGMVTAAIKIAPAVWLGGRPLPDRLEGVVALLAPTLLAALVTVQTLGADGRAVLDARAAGLITAGAAVAVRAPILAVAGAAALTAALVRALA